jgi:hypothetical protein
MRTGTVSREFPVIVDDALRIATLGGRAVQLSPTQSLDFAEDLIRRATRRMIIEESIEVRTPARVRK